MEPLEQLRNQIIELAQDNVQLSETLVEYLTDLAMQLRMGQVTRDHAADSLDTLTAIIVQSSGMVSEELQKARPWGE